MVQWLVFGGVWAALILLGAIASGSYSESVRRRLNSETEPFDIRRSHAVHIEVSTLLSIIMILLAGILAVLIAMLLVR